MVSDLRRKPVVMTIMSNKLGLVDTGCETVGLSLEGNRLGQASKVKHLVAL